LFSWVGCMQSLVPLMLAGLKGVEYAAAQLFRQQEWS